MKSLISLSVLAAVVLSIFTPASYADTLIYGNSNLSMSGFNGYDGSSLQEFIDYGTSSGGTLSKFTIDYWTESTSTGTIWVSFYRYTDYSDPGYLIKTFALTNVPSTGGFLDTYEYIIPEQDRFELPSGDFGYSFEMSRSTTYIATASGGQGNEDWFWIYDDRYEDFFRTYFDGIHSGFSMQVYTAPPIDEVTCDISGYLFDDSDGDGGWDAAEPALPGWLVYLDTNNNDQYDTAAEPNTVTDQSGMYLFENIDAPATYTIREVMQNGWTQTLPGGPDHEYTIATEPNNLYGPYNFGNTDQILSASVHGTITHDSNSDSILNPAEPKLAGWTVYADINGNTKHDTGEPSAVTNSNGEYQLTGLAPGSYTIAEVMEEGWVQTYPTAACTHQVTITTPDQVVENIDFGNHTFNGYGGGTGTSSDPYLIYNHFHLQAVGSRSTVSGQHFKLMDDIELSKYTGEQFNKISLFSGSFDGNGYTITNFSYHYSGVGQGNIGIFSQIYIYGEVKNLTVIDSVVNGGDNGVAIGAIVGNLDSGTITNCTVEGGFVNGNYFSSGAMVGEVGEDGIIDQCSAVNVSVTSTNMSAGGLAGFNRGTIRNSNAECMVTGVIDVGGLVGDNQWDGVIENCSSASTVVADQHVGGLVGGNSAVVTRCYSTATVSTQGTFQSDVGGLVGRNVNGQIDNCYAIAQVNGSSDCGGLVGLNWNTSEPTTITNCYSAGPVTGGGLVGYNINGEITNSFWNTQTSGRTYSDGGTGLPTADMQNKQTYLDAGWDFTDETTNGTDDIWKLCDGVSAYPGLIWTDPSICGATTVVLAAIEDTYIKEDDPDSNFGDATGISCGLSDSGAQRAFVKFDLSSIPEGQVIISATLQLDGSFFTFPTPEVEVHEVSNSWDEMTATWNDSPIIPTEPPLDQALVTIDLNTWNVTEKADNRYMRDKTLSLALRTDELTVTTCGFYSRDFFDTDSSPKLIIEYKPIFGGGTGTADDPYQVWTAEQMNTIGLYSNRWDRSYKLMTDISMADYTGSAYKPIGTGGGFRGVFDGDGHTISDFQAGALFDYINWGRIQELGLIAPVVSGDGALVDRLEWSQVAECWVDGGSVNGGFSVGGLIGNVTLSSIGGCWSSAAVNGTDDVGGLIGHTQPLCQIENCSAIGSVSGQSNVGGLVGTAEDTAITHCYSSGQVSGSSNVGGFCGFADYTYQDPNIAIGCFWDTISSQQPSSAIGTGLDTGSMQSQAIFTAAGWDFVAETQNGFIDDWAIPVGGGYPVLWHQLPTAPPLPSFAGGSGTQADPYQIATVEQLISIGHNSRLLDKHFRLVNDLDLLGQPFTMIANGAYAFMGSFDGNSHVIRNISISSPVCYSNMGFIGTVYAGHVFDVILQNMSLQVEYAQNVGSLVGLNRSGIIENCHSQNVDVLGQWPVGGLVGINYWHAYISNCSVIGSVAESNILNPLSSGVGGITGENSWWSTIEKSGANVTVSGGDMLGGLVGQTIIYGEIADCYAIGTITSTDGYVGGLAGRSIGSDFTRCYTACEITVPAEAFRVGAMGGHEQSGTYMDCFWDDQLNFGLPGFGYTKDTTVLIDTVGETTANMQMASTYQSQGWDFENVWDMRCEGMNYPRLQSEPILPGDFVCPEGVELNDLIILYDEWLAETLSLSADMAPSGGDGKVNLSDWAHLANAWMSSTGQAGWDADCDIAPETPDGQINELDLTEFADQWLYRSARYADIAPASAPDGRVDLLDYALFSENWQTGTD